MLTPELEASAQRVAEILISEMDADELAEIQALPDAKASPNDKASVAASAGALVNPYSEGSSPFKVWESAREHIGKGLPYASWVYSGSNSSNSVLAGKIWSEVEAALGSGAGGGTVLSRGGGNMGTVVSSAISFQKIFSMAKIKDQEGVPDYLELEMANNGAPARDGWFGDVDNAEECTKYVCQYVAGGAAFFFRFERDSNASLIEAPAGNAFQFCGLFANRNGEWFSKSYLKDDLKAVLDVVNASNDAVSDLGMKPSGSRSH